MSVAIIAERAGVSIATVSRVLNNSPRVNPETARLVREAARQIDYDRSKMRRGPRIGGRAGAAAAISERKTLTLGVIAVGRRQEDWFRRPLYTRVIASITRAAGEKAARVMMDEVTDPAASCALVRERSVDGAIIVVVHGCNPELVEGIARVIPVVRIMGEETTYPTIDQVRPDNTAIGQMAFQHFARLGCRRSAYVMSLPELELSVSRGVGFMLAAARSGAASPEIFIASRGRQNWLAGCPVTAFESLEQVADAIARRPADQRPDGLFLSNDHEAIGIYPILERRGIVPGRDVKIIGCNNDEQGIAMLNPPPATIEIGTDQIGRAALERLVHRIARPHDPACRILVNPQLIVMPAHPPDSLTQ